MDLLCLTIGATSSPVRVGVLFSFLLFIYFFFSALKCTASLVCQRPAAKAFSDKVFFIFFQNAEKILTGFRKAVKYLPAIEINMD